MNSNNAQDETAHTDPPDGTKTPASEQPYVFKHRPKVDGDPWEILLKPDLDADTERCNAWKEEVQTLLIFAGLFSAVVTAFVIESYKFLQPDPNAAVVGLLFHIASSINNSSPFPPSVDPSSISTPFSQTSSSVRINIFWFLSLILSLTTVLVGTVSLQWLREHQSYGGFSAKEKIAILHMRTVALEVWWVPQIFAALPVLLQAALTLFLAGLIDFVLPLGRKLTILVCIVIGLTLLFLAATTLLPTLQYFLFFTCFYPYRQPPDPCAFKSPQSRVVLTIFSPILRLLSYIFSHTYRSLYDNHHRHWPLLRRYNLLSYLGKALKQRSWSASDRKWLDLRDGYYQCIHDRDPHLYYHQRKWREEFPLSDLCQILVKIAKETHSTKHTKKLLGAVVHCFEDLSKSVWTNQATETYSSQRKDRYNNYFEQLLSHSQSIAKWLLHGGDYKYNQMEDPEIGKYLNSSNTLLCQWDQTFFFLSLLLEKHDSFDLSEYSIELGMQILSKSYTPSLTSHKKSHTIKLFFLTNYYNDWTMEYIGRKSICQLSLSVAKIVDALFRGAALHQIQGDKYLNALGTHSAMTNIVSRIAPWTHIYSLQSSGLDQQQLQEITSQYITSFNFIVDHLNNEMTISVPNSQKDTPSVLFYLTSCFIWQLLYWHTSREMLQDTHSKFGQRLKLLLEAVLQYRTWTSGQKNDVLEQQFAENDYSGHRLVTRFSEDWWHILFEYGHEIGLEIAKNHGTTSIEEHIVGSNPGPSSHHEDSVPSLENNVTGHSITSSSPSPSQYHGTAASPTPIDQPSASFSILHGQHHDPNARDQHNGENQEVLSDPPASTHHIVTVDNIENLSPSLSKLSQNEPHKPESDRGVSEPGPTNLPLLTMSAKSDITDGEASPSIVNKEQASTTPTDGTGMCNHIAIDVDSPDGAKEIATVDIVGVPTPRERDGPHMTIDVESHGGTDDIELVDVGGYRESCSSNERSEIGTEPMK